jgi:hypothetical protein
MTGHGEAFMGAIQNAGAVAYEEGLEAGRRETIEAIVRWLRDRAGVIDERCAKREREPLVVGVITCDLLRARASEVRLVIDAIEAGEPWGERKL